ncbi:MAG: transglutaminase domain-containing protein [Chitinophagaceae bacterium]|nr:transglutaminase domain-containing protein [Chitinophagaceae bacterium]
MLWLLLAVFMLGMNFMPNVVDPFSDHVSSAEEKVKMSRQVDEFQLSVAEKFTSVDNLYLYLLTHTRDTANKYLLLQNAEALLKKRFVHAYSVYSLRENWIAVLAGKLVWRNLSAKVIPDDILKGNAAACSQVSIVFMALCRKFDIPVRKVGLKGHYTTEAFVNNRWYFFDLDIKPDFGLVDERKSLDHILRDKEQYKLYKNTMLDSTDIDRVFSVVDYGLPNSNPAPRAAFFHLVTKVCSHWGWLVPLYFSIRLFTKRSGRSKQPIAR